jgi:hypothetical protein
MRIKSLILSAIALFVSATVLQAAVVYEFRQSSRSEVQNLPSMDVSGTATIDGFQSRVDFRGTSMYGNGVYVVSRDGSRSLTLVDPNNRTFAEIDLASIAQTLGQAQITVSNLKTNLKKMPTRLEIAGFPTDHYRLEASYEISINAGGVPVRQMVETQVEKWTTAAFGDVASIFIAGGEAMVTGNPQLDQLIAAEATQIPGLTLRQVITITTTPIRERSGRRGESVLSLAPRRQMSEFLISSIRIATADPAHFQIPANFRRVDSIRPSDQSGFHSVRMEP